MKTTILALALISSAAISSAFACSPEAQFIGKIKNYNVQQRSESTQECFYQIEFSQYNESMVCPLSMDEAIVNQFQDYSCSLKNGDFVSGYLVVKGQFIVIE